MVDARRLDADAIGKRAKVHAVVAMRLCNPPGFDQVSCRIRVAWRPTAHRDRRKSADNAGKQEVGKQQ
jgi:hypothetical protein